MMSVKMLAGMTKIAFAIGFVPALTCAFPPAAVAAEGKHFKVGGADLRRRTESRAADYFKAEDQLQLSA